MEVTSTPFPTTLTVHGRVLCCLPTDAME